MSYNKETGMYEGYIYCITNKMNNKKYIGQTTRTVNKRWKQHITTAKGENRKYPIHFAISKYGVDMFVIDTLESFSSGTEKELKTLLNNSEKYYIKIYKTTDNLFGYNLSIGGGILQQPYRKVKQYSIDGNLVKTWDSIKEVSDYYDINGSAIVDACKGESKTCLGFVWRYIEDDFNRYEIKNNNRRAVVKYSLDGKLIKIYPSISEAAVDNNSDITHIYHCCIGKNKTCKGYTYRYENDAFEKYDITNIKNNENYIYSTSKKINCYTLDDVFVKTYTSFHQAQLSVGLKSSSSLTDACNKRIMSSGGYKWYHANDPTQPDKTKIIV